MNHLAFFMLIEDKSNRFSTQGGNRGTSEMAQLHGC